MTVHMDWSTMTVGTVTAGYIHAEGHDAPMFIIGGVDEEQIRRHGHLLLAARDLAAFARSMIKAHDQWVSSGGSRLLFPKTAFKNARAAVDILDGL